MATLTIRLPDDKHLRLKKLAESQGLSINKLIEELSTIALVEFDTHIRKVITNQEKIELAEPQPISFLKLLRI